MKKMNCNSLHFLFFILIFFLPFLGFTQPLPFYEKSAEGYYYLTLSASIQDSVLFKKNSIVSKKGIQQSDEFTRFFLDTVELCCQPDPVVLCAYLKSAADTPYIILSDIADKGSLFQPRMQKSPDTDLFFEFQKPLCNNFDFGDYYFKCEKVSSNKIRLIQNERRENQFDTLNYQFTSTKWYLSDSLTYLFFSPDSGDEFFSYRAKAILVFVHKKLLDVRFDFSGTSTDGYGAFYYSPQKPFGYYQTNDAFFLVYTSGNVLEFRNGIWKENYRLPILYYGECDCPDE